VKRAGLSLHAVYTVAGDADLFRASLASVYADVDGVTVVTGHDRDWMGRTRDPGSLAAWLLGREGDPERKVTLVVLDERNEARTRNRAMDLAAPRRASLAVEPQSPSDRPPRPPDYFLIVDADEIYEGGTLGRLKEHARQRRRPVYRVAARRYFKRWNWRVGGLEWLTVLVRADIRLTWLRNRRIALARRALARLPLLPPAARWRVLGSEDVRPEVAVFHHGSYVGPRERIAAKLASFGHAAQVPPDWLERVWDRFHPQLRDFNPVYPARFPSVERIPLEALPTEIRDYPWPPEYLDR
jgi:hypothetical protein